MSDAGDRAVNKSRQKTLLSISEQKTSAKSSHKLKHIASPLRCVLCHRGAENLKSTGQFGESSKDSKEKDL